MNHKILVTGSHGCFGTAITVALRKIYGNQQVIASDLYFPTGGILRDGPYERINVLNPTYLAAILQENNVAEIYHMAAIHPTDAAINPMSEWDLEVKGLMNILQTAAEHNVKKVFWPANAEVDLLTISGIAKLAGEHWCRYYKHRYNLDVRTMKIAGDTQKAIEDILKLMEVTGVVV
jgi:nucleoside-diphosphate-sugar epimerase